jgi:hypothetical protein
VAQKAQMEKVKAAMVATTPGPEKLIRRGRLRLVPVRELERWLDANAARVLDEVS